MPINIGGVQFPHNTFCAVGARGFFGEGYWFHRYFKLLGLTWKDTNFCAKTTTFWPEKGGLALSDDGILPAEYFPRCILVGQKGHVLNAVGLSGPGMEKLIDQLLWQTISEPFCLSFMAVGEDEAKREAEYWECSAYFTNLFLNSQKGLGRPFRSPFVLQLNFGCPNAGLSFEELRKEIVRSLKIISVIGVPLMPNFNPLVPAGLLRELQDTGLCAGFWIANTIPYDHDELGKSIFGQDVSPLTQRGFPSAGGISGPRCLIYTLETVANARKYGVTLPIIAGNGIRNSEDVFLLKDVGTTGIAIGSIAMVPPYMIRMRSVIRTANEIMGN